ncbi:MAG TPA: ClpXP protease specificity-enhancing factor [Burkholderiales bacterium]|jgi:stringent starvation protein B|nr:ClpXP protease specificity-enhancing factor [Burkholderiales bacterium]
MTDISIRPYMIRAVCEWCADVGYTPYLAVKVNMATRVPIGYVKNGEIVLNVSHSATRNLTISNELIQFSARFGGVSQEISIPIEAVAGVFARENGKGMFFEVEQQDGQQGSGLSLASGDAVDGGPLPESPSPRKPHLTVIK